MVQLVRMNFHKEIHNSTLEYIPSMTRLSPLSPRDPPPTKPPLHFVSHGDGLDADQFSL